MKATLLMFALAAAAFTSHGAPPSAGPDRGRPNLLFIYTDDQRWDALSVVQREQGERARFPWLTTPNMDRLAAEGVRFRQAFVVCSLCAPSRAVNLTGRYNHENGIASNFRPFPPDSVTHATLLRAAGYTTTYIGKWHMGSQRERPGFDHHASYIGHAVYHNPTFVVDGQDVKKQGWIDDIATDYAVDFIKRQKDAAKPWSLVVGFKSPHGPFEPPPRARERFAGAEARPAPNMGAPVPYLGQTTPRPPPAKIAAHLDYFRCISGVDDCLGRLLAALDETDAAARTVVIYTSDNGFYLGEHGLGDKRSAYDESLRVPFIVRAPMAGAAARGRVCDAMVLNLDLAPSLLDLAGVAIPPEMQGRSWRPLLAGPVADWRQAWFYEYFAERQKNSRVPDITAVRTADAKLIRYAGHDDWTELFDLAADPYETRNLFADPAGAELRKKLEAEHERLARATGYRVPAYVDRPAGWSDAGFAPPVAAKSGVVLDLDCGRLAAETVRDRSGNGNDGVARKVVLADGRNGGKALRFGGDGFVEVPKTPSLDPSETAWAVSVGVRADTPDGLILARGGRTSGYALVLRAGRPAFAVNVANKQTLISGEVSIAGRWADLAARIAADRRIVLLVDGRQVAQGHLPSLIASDPNDAMEVGADEGSPVVEPPPPRLTGLVDRVRLFRGESAD